MSFIVSMYRERDGCREREIAMPIERERERKREKERELAAIHSLYRED